MKKTIFHFLSLITACTLLAGVAYAGAHRMVDAIDALRRAKTAADPWKELNIAADNLRHATKTKVVTGPKRCTSSRARSPPIPTRSRWIA